MFEVEYTDEFKAWWDTLHEEEQIDVAACVGLLEQLGPNLRFPRSSGIEGSKYQHMRELRVQHAGRPYRIYMHLIQDDALFYWQVEIKQAMIVGMKSMFH